MLANFLRTKKFSLLLAGLIVLGISACKDNRLKNVDVSNISLQLDIARFENDLFAEIPDSTKFSRLKNKYTSFYKLYCQYIISAGNATDPATVQYVKEFYTNVDIKSLYADVHQQFNAIDVVKSGLEDALKHYKYYFPNKHIPQVLTFISGFNYNIVTDSTTLGLGLDMYLGRTYKHYQGIELPMYKIVRMQPEYVVPDAMKGLVQSEFSFDEFKTQNLLTQMVYFGKQWYLLDALMPNTPDTLKTGFTTKQQQWCKSNEREIWGYFVEQKLLFNTNQDKYMRFVTDGPTTNGLPKNSPAMLGAWMGLQIVRSYMNHHPQVTLAQLMQNNDAQRILNESKYKP